MKVDELIKHLETMDRDLPVFYVMFDDGYNVTEVTEEDVIVSSLEDKNGKEFPCVILGEERLL